MLIEIFCKKPIVSNVILAFLDHLKPKTFFVGQPWSPTYSAIPFQNLWIHPSVSLFKFCMICNFSKCDGFTVL